MFIDRSCGCDSAAISALEATDSLAAAKASPIPADGANSPPCACATTHRVLELFAGVGGFHLGLHQANLRLTEQGLPPGFEVVWANQWEPASRSQHAARVYSMQWTNPLVNRNLFEVLEDSAEMARIDSLAPTMLVGGFPCQDYSVAKPLAFSGGIEGRKGVLWWGIYRVLERRLVAGAPITHVLLENVDRLPQSPGKVRGRDFAIILSSLQALGYAVAWQVVNAADYGHPQRRRRVFIAAVHRTSPEYAGWQAAATSPQDWLAGQAQGNDAAASRGSPLARALPVALAGAVESFALGADVLATQEDYLPGRNNRSLFRSAGVCVDGRVWTAPARAAEFTDYTRFIGHAEPRTLGDVVAVTEDVEESFHINPNELGRWTRLKGAKRVDRVSRTGHAYVFSEGAVAFPDPLDRPSRTVITSEGGKAATRSKHVVRTADGRLRRLTPEELEELTGFPRGFTAVAGVRDTQRAFLMGNALVPGLVARIAHEMSLG